MKIVTSYINPDLDGLASGVVYAAYLAPSNMQPLFVGRPSAEAAGVVDRLSLNEAITWASPESEEWDDVALVDCHHPAQLPHVGNLDTVSVVIDHHPDGDAAAFPKASVQNELVGAAATLVAERVIATSQLAALSPTHAALLAAAIASNTLDFVAPSTTDRDQLAYTTLATLAAPVVALDELREEMREWRQGFLTLATREAIAKDCKLIETPYGLVAVSQIEGDNARLLADRTDIFDQIAELVTATNAVGGLVSLVDTFSNTTTLVTADQEVQKTLLELKPTTVRDGILQLPFIALRKTHIIPAIRYPPKTLGARATISRQE